jgi:hypothetical protein
VLNSAIESAQSGTEERPHWCEGAFKEDQRQGIYIAYLCCLPTPRVNLADQQPHTLVVGRIQPEHPIEDAPGPIDSAKASTAQPATVHAA